MKSGDILFFWCRVVIRWWLSWGEGDRLSLMCCMHWVVYCWIGVLILDGEQEQGRIFMDTLVEFTKRYLDWKDHERELMFTTGMINYLRKPRTYITPLFLKIAWSIHQARKEDSGFPMDSSRKCKIPLPSWINLIQQTFIFKSGVDNCHSNEHNYLIPFDTLRWLSFSVCAGAIISSHIHLQHHHSYLVYNN